jgi:hypothetical protein
VQAVIVVVSACRMAHGRYHNRAGDRRSPRLKEGGQPLSSEVLRRYLRYYL